MLSSSSNLLILTGYFHIFVKKKFVDNKKNIHRCTTGCWLQRYNFFFYEVLSAAKQVPDDVPLIRNQFPCNNRGHIFLSSIKHITSAVLLYTFNN